MFRPSSRFYSCRCSHNVRFDVDGAAGVLLARCCCCCCQVLNCPMKTPTHTRTHQGMYICTHTHTYGNAYTNTHAHARTHWPSKRSPTQLTYVRVCVCVCDFVILLDGISKWTAPLYALTARAAAAPNQKVAAYFSARRKNH